MKACTFCGLNDPHHSEHCPVVNGNYKDFWAGWHDHHDHKWVAKEGEDLNTLQTSTYGLGVWADILEACRTEAGWGDYSD